MLGQDKINTHLQIISEFLRWWYLFKHDILFFGVGLSVMLFLVKLSVIKCLSTSQGADGIRGLKGSKGEKVSEKDSEPLLKCLLLNCGL